MIPRLYVDSALATGTAAAGTPGQAHYLAGVLRLGLGAPVILFNGRDGEFAARIGGLRKDRAVFEVGALARAQAPEPDVWLAFALLKRDATDLVVQKATELGASRILPLFTARTNAGRVNLDRLRAIAIEAAEQSERLTVPEVAPPQELSALLAAWPADRPLAAALERAGAPPPATGAGGLLIGPEGGFAPAELDAMGDKPFIQRASLGPRILRAETAAIAGLALILARH